jgi:LuxR family maltose regulon positive regulatory protein
VLLPFLRHPSPALLDRRRRQNGAHAAWLLRPCLLRHESAQAASLQGAPANLREALSESELRVLDYLPSGLSTPEIADQLYVSVNTVKTHMRHLYDKLGAHRRVEAIEAARGLGLLSASSRRS